MNGISATVTANVSYWRQAGAEGDFNDPQANIDPAESVAAVNAIADIMQSMRRV